MAAASGVLAALYTRNVGAFGGVVAAHTAMAFTLVGSFVLDLE